MHSIQIPVADISLKRMQVFCEKYNCKAKYAFKNRAYFEISSEDAINFFWLGANMGAAFTRSLDTPLSQGPTI